MAPTPTATDDTQRLLLQLIDQSQATVTKADALSRQINELTQQQDQLTRVIGNLISVTTAVEIATAVALVMAAISLYLLTRWRSSQPHNHRLPTTATIPPVQSECRDRDRDRDRDEGNIDTLAELARVLTKEQLR